MKKSNIKLAFILSAFFGLVILSSCGSSDDDDNSPAYVGTWGGSSGNVAVQTTGGAFDPAGWSSFGLDITDDNVVISGVPSEATFLSNGSESYTVSDRTLRFGSSTAVLSVDGSTLTFTTTIPTGGITDRVEYIGDTEFVIELTK